MPDHQPRRAFLQQVVGLWAAVGWPGGLAGGIDDPDRERLQHWIARLRREGFTRAGVPLGGSVVRAGELAAGTPYEPGTLEAYLRAGGDPTGTEPLTLSLTRFDCVTLVESCLAVARVAAQAGRPTWARFGQEIERMRYRGGERRDYSSRLHYFSEWIADGASRGLVQDLGPALGGTRDDRPLRFMTEHRQSYQALTSEPALQAIAAMEHRLDGAARVFIPSARIPEIAPDIASGDVLAFATSIPGLDVTHAALAYRDATGTLRVLHAPLSGGVVEITRSTLPEYVAAIRDGTGIYVARPLPG